MRVGLTIGIAIFPQDGADAVTLVANADAALFRAKRKRAARCASSSCRWTSCCASGARCSRTCATPSRATSSICIISRRRISAARSPASRRWCAGIIRASGWCSPATFIPLAEETGIIVALGEWVLRTACREAASWPKPLRVAVNLSPVQFQRGDLAKLVHEVLLETGLVAVAARARDHRGRADRRFHRRGGHPAPAEEPRRAHRHGRFRHRLFVAVLSAVVPVRQDQDRPGLRRQSRATASRPSPSSAR